MEMTMMAGLVAQGEEVAIVAVTPVAVAARTAVLAEEGMTMTVTMIDEKIEPRLLIGRSGDSGSTNELCGGDVGEGNDHVKAVVAHDKLSQALTRDT
jgi:hypothetical protein